MIFELSSLYSYPLLVKAFTFAFVSLKSFFVVIFAASSAYCLLMAVTSY